MVAGKEGIFDDKARARCLVKFRSRPINNKT